MSEATPLDEPVRRLPGWSPGVEVELANGQCWHVPRPRARFPGQALRIYGPAGTQR